MLPHWNGDGLLDEGIWPATMADVYERMVLDADNRARRELLFHALTAYIELIKQFVPNGRVWVDGGFGMKKTRRATRR